MLQTFPSDSAPCILPPIRAAPAKAVATCKAIPVVAVADCNPLLGNSAQPLGNRRGTVRAAGVGGRADMDLVYVLISAAFFAVSIAYARACDRL